MKITAVLEGPIAFDGKQYYHGKGESIYLDNIAKNVSELILITYVFKPEHKDYATACQTRLHENNIKVIELPFNPDQHYSPIQKIVHFYEVFKTIYKNKMQGDIFYFFIPSYPSAILWLINLKLKKPYIVYSASDWVELSENLFKWHDTIYKYFFGVVIKFNKLIEEKIATNAEFCLTAGHALYEKFRKYNELTYLTIPRINLTKNDIYYRENTCTSTNIKIITVGDLIPRKNLNYLLNEVANYIKTSGKNINIDIVGIGPCEEELKDYVLQLGIQKFVNFIGYVKDTDKLINLYRRADIYVLTSKSEGFPRVLYEALSQGLPLITSDCGGVTGLIKNKVNGIVIDINKKYALCEALDILLKNEKLRKDIIKNGNDTIKDVLEKSDPRQVINLINQHCNYIS